MSYIRTFTGRQFNFLVLRPEDIAIEDIARSLAMQCRFVGHVSKFYSVAEHSFLASLLVPQEDARWALLHDAAEAYLADMSRPLKHFTNLGDIYRELEDKVMRVICKKFGLPLMPDGVDKPESVTLVDNALLALEEQQLKSAKCVWDDSWVTCEIPKIALPCFSWQAAETVFLDRFRTLFN